MRIRLTIVLIAVFCLSASAQSGDPEYYETEEVTNLQVWTDYNPRWSINNSWSVRGMVGARTIIPTAWYRFLARPSLVYEFLTYNEKKERYRAWQIHGGLGAYYTYNIGSVDNLEIRPYQGISVRFPNLDRLYLSHFLRLEERFEIGVGSSYQDFSMRFRYRIGSDFYFPGKFFMKGFYIPIYLELFIGIQDGTQFNDLIRITPGLGYTPNENLRFQFDLSYHRSTDLVKEGYKTNDIVGRIRMIQKF